MAGVAGTLQEPRAWWQECAGGAVTVERRSGARALGPVKPVGKARRVSIIGQKLSPKVHCSLCEWVGEGQGAAGGVLAADPA